MAAVKKLKWINMRFSLEVELMKLNYGLGIYFLSFPAPLPRAYLTLVNKDDF